MAPPMVDLDSDDEEYLPAADPHVLVWPEEPVPDNWEYLCIHEIPRPATPPLHPNQGVPATPPQQADQIEMHLDHELMELQNPADIPDLIYVP